MINNCFYSAANTPSRPGSALRAAEEQAKLLHTIQQQSEQITSLISTVNTQVCVCVSNK